MPGLPSFDHHARVGLDLFPEQASTMAPRVDALYLFLVGLTIFFAGSSPH